MKVTQIHYILLWQTSKSLNRYYNYIYLTKIYFPISIPTSKSIKVAYYVYITVHYITRESTGKTTEERRRKKLTYC